MRAIELQLLLGHHLVQRRIERAAIARADGAGQRQQHRAAVFWRSAGGRLLLAGRHRGGAHAEQTGGEELSFLHA
jgi:hypothetical protein